MLEGLIHILASNSILFFFAGAVTGAALYAVRDYRIELERVRKELCVAKALKSTGGPAEPVLVPTSPDDMVLIRKQIEDEASRY